MANFGIRVVQRGEDIDTATPDTVTFSSEYQSPKVLEPYRDSFQANNLGNGSVTINHPLPYAPVALAFYKTGVTNWRTVDNFDVALETNRRSFSIRLRTANENSVNDLFANQRVDYKVWLMTDPAQEIL